MDVEVIGTFNHQELLREVKSLESFYRMNPYEQISLQAPYENSDPNEWIRKTNGRVSKLEYKEEEYVYPLFNYQLINHYIKKYNMYRTRIMNIQTKRCLSYHYDFQKRIHFPLVTNAKCMMIVDDKVYRLEVGKIYLVDTTKMHLAINGNKNQFHRIHIVGCVKE